MFRSKCVRFSQQINLRLEETFDPTLIVSWTMDAYYDNYAKCEDGDEKDGQVGDSVSEVEGNGVVIFQEQPKCPCSD